MGLFCTDRGTMGGGTDFVSEDKSRIGLGAGGGVDLEEAGFAAEIGLEGLEGLEYDFDIDLGAEVGIDLRIETGADNEGNPILFLQAVRNS